METTSKRNELVEIIEAKFGSQAECARVLNWDRQNLNKLILKKREAKVTDVNALARVLELSVERVVFLLS